MSTERSDSVGGTYIILPPSLTGSRHISDKMVERPGGPEVGEYQSKTVSSGRDRSVTLVISQQL